MQEGQLCVSSARKGYAVGTGHWQHSELACSKQFRWEQVKLAVLFYLFSFLFMLWVEDILLQFMYRHV